VKCWGQNNKGQVIILCTALFLHISIVDLRCFFVQLGDNSTTDRFTPVEVVGLGSGVISVALGSVRFFVKCFCLG